MTALAFDVSVAVERCVVLGILNVTPDSFSDGGRFERLGSAIAAGLALVRQGADMVYVGGESTRPGAVAALAASAGAWGVRVHAVAPAAAAVRVAARVETARVGGR